MTTDSRFFILAGLESSILFEIHNYRGQPSFEENYGFTSASFFSKWLSLFTIYTSKSKHTHCIKHSRQPVFRRSIIHFERIERPWKWLWYFPRNQFAARSSHEIVAVRSLRNFRRTVQDFRFRTALLVSPPHRLSLTSRHPLFGPMLQAASADPDPRPFEARSFKVSTASDAAVDRQLLRPAKASSCPLAITPHRVGNQLPWKPGGIR